MDGLNIITIVNASTGVLFIVLGFLVKKYPNLIAGYNTMSSEEKAKVDVDGLSSHMKRGLIVMGVAVLATSLILGPMLSIGLETIVFLVITVLGIIYIFLGAQKFKPNKK